MFECARISLRVCVPPLRKDRSLNIDIKKVQCTLRQHIETGSSQNSIYYDIGVAVDLSGPNTKMYIVQLVVKERQF